MMGSMEQIERTYLVGDVQCRVPKAKCGGSLMVRNRYKAVADGIAACLWACPVSDKVLVTHLQAAWVECERALSRLPVPPEDSAQMEFGG